MHITSLPAERSYCGQFGDEQTLKFIDWLVEAKQTHWIMNPLNELTEDLCPYNSVGRFSRNKYIVNLNKLTTKEYGNLLSVKDLPDDITAPSFTLEMLEKQKNPRFEKAFQKFQKLSENAPIKQEYNKFLNENNDLWLDSYASYSVLSKRYGSEWLKWDKVLQTAPEDAQKEGISLSDKVLKILKMDTSIKSDLEQYKFEQFLYDKQFNEMVDYLDEKGIRLIMDLPVGVNPNGVDVWANKNIFLLDENFKPTKVSGCPPEKNYPYTQVWGHALYNYDSPEFWEYQESSLKQLLKTSDLRLDHFVGYVNRAAIPTVYEKLNGEILKDSEIFSSVENGGMGNEFFKEDWVEDIYSKRSPNGENIFELFIRVANELGKDSKQTYILESFGPLANTKLYKKFDKNYGENFISQQVPVGMDIFDSKNKKKLSTDVALLTGNHDLPPLREYLDKLLDTSNVRDSKMKKTKEKFLNFCDKELNLTPEEMKDPDVIYENLLKWHYTNDAKQVQTTLQDALGIYWRPNIPGNWNGMYDKFLQKTTPEAMLPYWSKVFPKDFLERDNKTGINPGYKELADNFIKIMNDLYPNQN